MSLKDFEHSGVHDLFKVCNHFFFLLKIYIYIYFHLTFIFIHSFSSFLSYVKIYCNVPASHRSRQDEDLVRDENSGSERGI